MQLRYLLPLLVLTFAFTLGNAQEFKGNVWYQFQNRTLGNASVLAMSPYEKNVPIMSSKPGNNSQFWKLTHLGSGFYRITNRSLGNNRSLDAKGSSPAEVKMSRTGNFSGQFWKITQEGKGIYRLHNQKLRSGITLQLTSPKEGKLVLRKAKDLPIQRWTITELDKITGEDLETPKTSKKFQHLDAEKKIAAFSGNVLQFHTHPQSL